MTSGSIHAEGRYLCRLCGDSASIFLLHYGQTKKPTKLLNRNLPIFRRPIVNHMQYKAHLWPVRTCAI